MSAPNTDPTRTHSPNPNDPLTATSPADPNATHSHATGSVAAKQHGAIPGYELLEELDRGGMAVVHKARHIKLNRIIALKTMLRADAISRARFLAEAEAVAAIQHPHVVQAFDYGDREGAP